MAVSKDEKAVSEHEHPGDAGDPERAQWGGKLEFFLTMVGYAVGLGNVWRFPYLCYQNGGGAFLIPFTIMMVVVGSPVFLMELGIGQFASLGPSKAWEFAPIWKGIGISAMLVAFIIVLYYNIIVVWCMYYFFASMASPLPWESCGNCWNTLGCIESDYNYTGGNNTLNGFPVRTSAEEYFYNNVLQLSSGVEEMGTIVWQLAVLLFLAWSIIFLVLINGINSLGKVMYFVSLFPYFMLTVMLIGGAFLPGAGTGVEYYIRPQWEKLLEGEVWADAVAQVFYSCGVCCGGIMGMASFNKFDYNIKRDAILVPVVVWFTSLYAGFVVFCVLGYLAYMKGVDISEVVDEGPGLVFVAYPEGLSMMPGATLWAILFFFMMCTLGMSSQFSTGEAVCTTIMDEFPKLKPGSRPMILRAVYCTISFLLGLPMCMQGGFYVFQIFDWYTASYPILVVGVMELIVVTYVYGYKRFLEDMEMILGYKLSFLWVIMWGCLSPICIAIMLIIQAVNEGPLTIGSYTYPEWSMAIAWTIVGIPISVLFGWCLVEILKEGGWTIIKKSSRPTEKWHPALLENRTGRYAPAGDLQMVEKQNGEVGRLNLAYDSEASPTGVVQMVEKGNGEDGHIISAYDSETPPNGSPQMVEKVGHLNMAYEHVDEDMGHASKF